MLHKGLRVRPMFLPDHFVIHGAPGEQYEVAGLQTEHIVAEVFAALNGEAKKIIDFKAKA